MILFLTEPEEDYLSDSILHGLRKIYGQNVIDYPKCEPLYDNCNAKIFKNIRGNGFTLYKTLPDIEIDRYHILEKIKNNYFDYIFFGNIQRLYHYFIEILPYLNPQKTILLDGEDTPSIAPYSGKWWRNSNSLLISKAHKKFFYFKREWTPETYNYRNYKLIPKNISNILYKNLKINKISFSIPDEKIIKNKVKKQKLFTNHIVDKEVSVYLNAKYTYCYDNEVDYYDDLQISKFGITTKRAGWDCLRHYEMAANGCVLCFKDLNKKPENCAPHGLSRINSITYNNINDLINKINSLSEEDYENLRIESLKWAHSKSSIAMAKYIINTVEAYIQC